MLFNWQKNTFALILPDYCCLPKHLSNSVFGPVISVEIKVSVAKYLHKNMRIPAQSIIHRAFDDEAQVSMHANESLGLWETKKGGYLPPIPMTVEARKQGNSVHALLVQKAT